MYFCSARFFHGIDPNDASIVWSNQKEYNWTIAL
jgi:hypothetical protein